MKKIRKDTYRHKAILCNVSGIFPPFLSIFMEIVRSIFAFAGLYSSVGSRGAGAPLPQNFQNF